MAVAPVTSATASAETKKGSSADQASASSSLNYDSFLRLLIAQMKNQDPTDPMKASEQIAQLATFSQVEQTIQTNKNLESLISGSALDMATSYIGKTVTSADGKTSGVVASIKVYSDAIVATTTTGATIPLGIGVSVKDTAPST